MKLKLIYTLFFLTLVQSTVYAQNHGTVQKLQKITQNQGGFTGALSNSNQFGVSVATLGDLNHDGTRDLIVGANFDDNGGTNRGAVWILFMKPDLTVKSQQKISDTLGNFTAPLINNDFFGTAVEFMGDLDGDGVGDVAVGADQDDDGGLDRGAIYILFLKLDGTVRTFNGYTKISDIQGGFTGVLANSDNFGGAIAQVGDINDDGVTDLAVGVGNDNTAGTNRGAVWILFLNSNGTVNGHMKIGSLQGGFTGTLDNGDEFGSSVSTIGDINEDGIVDLIVGAPGDDDGTTDAGAVWVLFLNDDGTVQSHQKISATQGGFSGTLNTQDLFGVSVSKLPDLDGNGINDLAVGAMLDDNLTTGSNQGAVWILFLDNTGMLINEQKINEVEGNFSENGGVLNNNDRFGASLAFLGDLNMDGITELVSGAYFDDSAGSDKGAVWVMQMHGWQTPPMDDELPEIDIMPNANQNKLTVITHGWQPLIFPSPSTLDDIQWIDDMASRIDNDVNLTTNSWKIYPLDWFEEAHKITPGLAFNNAKTQGQRLGAQIKDFETTYTHVHFIAHSAGARLIHEAANVLKDSSISVHSTFLDPYDPTFQRQYGLNTLWSDNYYNIDIAPFTYGLFHNANNVDLSCLSLYDVDTTHTYSVSGHSYPWSWYLDSISSNSIQLGYNEYGYIRSAEANTSINVDDIMNDNLLNYPIGNGFVLNDITLIGNCNLYPVYNYMHVDNNIITFDTLNSTSSLTGTVIINDSSFELYTGSPAWLIMEIPVGSPFNFITFDSEFTSFQSDPLPKSRLSLSWNFEEIGSLEESFEPQGVEPQVFGLPGDITSGTHVLGFRLDNTNLTSSSIVISNLQSHYITQTSLSTSPTVVSINVIDALNIEIEFSEVMGFGIENNLNYSLSDSGQGSLAANPTNVTQIAGQKYKLTWLSGNMVNGGDITITVENVYDLGGDLIGVPNSATHINGGVPINLGIFRIE